MMSKWLLILLTFYPCLLKAQSEERFVAVTDEVEESISRGLKWLAKNQRPDGFFNCGIGNRVGYGYDIHITEAHVGVTAIAGMAFLANGHVPGVGPYADVVDKCLKAVLSAAGPNGFITTYNSRMYSHTFAVLFLAEVYGMTRNSQIRPVLKRAVKLLVDHQNQDGGWRYSPEAVDSDLSVVVCVVQALRAANNAGIHVSKKTIDNAVKYIHSLVVTNPKQTLATLHGDSYPVLAKEGGFHYQLNERITFAIAAAGVTALHGTGLYQGPVLDLGLRFLERRYIEKLHKTKNYSILRSLPQTEGYETNFRGRLTRQGRFLNSKLQGFQYFYGHYYATQAFYQTGGARWERWYTTLREDFIQIQFPQGHWNDEVGPTYATSMATLILALPKGYLPIFQR